MMVSVTARRTCQPIPDPDLTVYDPFIALLYIGMVIACIVTTPPDRCEIQLSRNFCTIWYSLLLFSKCRRKYARCKAQQPLFRQNSIPLTRLWDMQCLLLPYWEQPFSSFA